MTYWHFFMHEQFFQLSQHTLYLPLVITIPCAILIAELCREQNEQPAEMLFLCQVL